MVLLLKSAGAEVVGSSVSAGATSACGVRPDGSVTCWGEDSYGDTSPPADTFKQISVNAYHACGVRTDGTVACWGRNDYGQVSPPVGTFTEVSAGILHTCGLMTDGTAACWGHNAFGQASPPVGTFTQVSAGQYDTCGVRPDGALACWGRNNVGQAVPPRHIHPGQCWERRPRLRREDGRYRRLLGLQHRRADLSSRRHLLPGQRWHPLHLRSEDGQHSRLLGLQRLRADLAACRHIHRGQRWLLLWLRAEDRRHACLLGQKLLRRGLAAFGAVWTATATDSPTPTPSPSPSPTPSPAAAFTSTGEYCLSGDSTGAGWSWSIVFPLREAAQSGCNVQGGCAMLSFLSGCQGLLSHLLPEARALCFRRPVTCWHYARPYLMVDNNVSHRLWSGAKERASSATLKRLADH